MTEQLTPAQLEERKKRQDVCMQELMAYMETVLNKHTSKLDMKTVIHGTGQTEHIMSVLAQSSVEVSN